MSFSNLARAIKQFEMTRGQENADVVLSFTTLPIVEDKVASSQVQVVLIYTCVREKWPAFLGHSKFFSALVQRTGG